MTTIANRTTFEAQVAAAELERQLENESALVQWLAEVDDELPAAMHEFRASRHADNTRRAYDYWLGRLRAWMEDPLERHRMTAKPALALEQLFPIGRVSEILIGAWITDEVLGPVDPDEAEEWAQTTGPWAPATLDAVMAALKARSRNFQSSRWAPSDDMTEMLKGLRRKLSERYRIRQATPLLADQIIGMCRHLWRVESPLLARDRLVFEMTVAGIAPGQIARVGCSSIVAGGAHDAVRSASAAGADVTWTETGVFGRRLVIAGQRRRGGNQDPPAVLDLAKQPQLEFALDRWLEARDVEGDRLLFGNVGNPIDLVRKSLIRTAELAEVNWRPARNAVIDPADVVLIRTALDQRSAWGGEMVRQRDHVMVLVGFFAALRRSELCALTIVDVDFVSDTSAQLWIGPSKTDSVGTELIVWNPRNVLAETQVVTLLRSWIDTLRGLGATDKTPLFPAFDRHGNVKTKNGAPTSVSGADWSNRLNGLARKAEVFGDGNERKYDLVSGHSLRRGFVTQAILRGNDAVRISKITRHKNVQMIAVYADTVLARKADWMAYLFGGDQLAS